MVTHQLGADPVGNCLPSGTVNTNSIAFTQPPPISADTSPLLAEQHLCHLRLWLLTERLRPQPEDSWIAVTRQQFSSPGKADDGHAEALNQTAGHSESFNSSTASVDRWMRRLKGVTNILRTHPKATGQQQMTRPRSHQNRQRAGTGLKCCQTQTTSDYSDPLTGRKHD